MKLSEYEIFESKIKEKVKDEGISPLILNESWTFLSFEELREINNLIQKKIKIKKIKGAL
ncbi:MAG: hypothetical protein ACHQYQ_11750 [Bacteriovoracales bacterium]